MNFGQRNANTAFISPPESSNNDTSKIATVPLLPLPVLVAISISLISTIAYNFNYEIVYGMLPWISYLCCFYGVETTSSINVSLNNVSNLLQLNLEVHVDTLCIETSYFFFFFFAGFCAFSVIVFFSF